MGQRMLEELDDLLDLQRWQRVVRTFDDGHLVGCVENQKDRETELVAGMRGTSRTTEHEGFERIEEIKM